MTKYTQVDLTNLCTSSSQVRTKPFFCDQNILTCGYRQHTQMAKCSLVVMTIKPGTFTTIFPPTFSQLKNHSGYTLTAERWHAPKQQFAHPVQALGYNFWSVPFLGQNLFKFLEFLQRWAVNTDRLKPSMRSFCHVPLPLFPCLP